MKSFPAVFLCSALSLSSLSAQSDNVSPTLAKSLVPDININGTVAFCVESDIPDSSPASQMGDTPMPMQSVFKFPLALAILHEVDKGNLELDQKITVAPKELLPDTWSPLRDRNPQGGQFTIAELLSVCVAESDNNACDILIRLLGGTGKLNSYIQNTLGIKDIHILYTEKEMHEDETRQYANSSTANAMTKLLKLFADGKILSPETTDFLMKVMLETKTGTTRIKGLLPEGTLVAHKTGSSGLSKDRGMIAATNDAGIIFLPGKIRIFISVFISNSSNNQADIEKAIAKISNYYFTRVMQQK